jgi:hypothetical protein
MTQPTPSAGLSARIGVAFALECRDADGNVLKTIPVTGALSLPLTETTEEEANDALDRSQ